MADRIHTCIDALYTAALNPQAWPAALDRVANLFGADQASIGPLGRTARHNFRMSSVPDDRGEVYRASWADQDRLADHLSARPQALFIETQVLAEADLAAHFTTSYCSRFTIGARFGATIEPLPGHVVALAIARNAAAPAPEAADLKLVAILRGHLERVARLSLGEARRGSGADPLEAVLEGLDSAAALVRGSGRVEYANRRLLALGGDGLSVARGTLKAETGDDQDALDALVAQALQPAGSPASGVPARLRRSSGLRPLLVHARPLPTDAEPDPLWHPAEQQSALIIAVDPERSRQAEHAPALRLLGLTRTEARIAALIADAESPDSIARICDIEPSTVRVHLKHIYAKLDVRGQVELAVLLSRMGNPLGDAFTPHVAAGAAEPRPSSRLHHS